MIKSNLTVEIKIVDLDQFKGLLKALEENFDDLPEKVKESLSKFCDDKAV